MSEDSINSILWDIKAEDKKSLSDDFLIKRALVYGGAFIVKDALNTYGKERVKKIFETLKISEVGKKRFHFYKNYLFV